MVTCSAGAELKCKGTAPAFACSGTCTGSCELNAGAKCEGECKGSCELDGTAACNGECMGTEAGGMCTGQCKLAAGASCEGTCNGTCELKAGGMCTGECKGECEYTPPMGTCDASATAKCEGMAGAMVECSGKCSGEAKPPAVKTECEATAKAEASFNAECTPPKLEIKYDLTADARTKFAGDATLKAAFEGKIHTIGKAFANLTAKGAKITAVIKAGEGLGASGVTAVNGALQAAGSAELSTGAKLDLACGLAAFAGVPALVTEAAGSLGVSAKAVADVTIALKG
jgi:hypothetical protein